MKHIIDADELEKLKVYASNTYIDAKTRMPVTDEFIKKSDVLNLLANSPQADGMVLVPSEPTTEMIRALMNGWETDGSKPMRDNYKAMLSAYKPQHKARE